MNFCSPHMESRQSHSTTRLSRSLTLGFVKGAIGDIISENNYVQTRKRDHDPMIHHNLNQI